MDNAKPRLSLRWWIPLLLAIQFLTRIPVPGLNRLDADSAREGLSRSVIWFPLVGGLIGLMTLAVLLLCETLWPRIIAVILALIFEARLTGAFHEDAVADFCDGFGGGMTSQRIHEIMKDSRIGTYGMLGLALAVSLRASLLCLVPAILLPSTLIASASFGRWLSLTAMAYVPPMAVVEGIAKDIGGRTSPRQWLIGTLIALPFLLPFIVLLPVAALLGLAAALLFLCWFHGFVLQHLGGVTGDCLGFVAYAGQLLVLLAATARFTQ